MDGCDVTDGSVRQSSDSNGTVLTETPLPPSPSLPLPLPLENNITFNVPHHPPFPLIINPSPSLPLTQFSQKRRLPPRSLRITLHLRDRHPQPLHHLLTNLMTPRHIHAPQSHGPHARDRRLRRSAVRPISHSSMIMLCLLLLGLRLWMM